MRTTAKPGMTTDPLLLRLDPNEEIGLPADSTRAADPDRHPMLTAALCFAALVVMHFGGWLP